MSEYAFQSVSESPNAKRSRHQRMAIAFCVTLTIFVGGGFLWRKYQPGEASSLWENLIDGLIACVVSIMQGENTKSSAQKLRREFKLRIGTENIIREVKPLTLSRSEIKAIYLAPHKSLWITSSDSRRKIVVPGDLEEREYLIRELTSLGLPLRSFLDWLVDIAFRRFLIAAIMSMAVIVLWFPGPIWRSAFATAVLLGFCGWYLLRVGGDPNVEHVWLERIVTAIAAIGILWRGAHLLSRLWP